MHRSHRKSIGPFALPALIVLALYPVTLPPSGRAGEAGRDWTVTLDAVAVWQSTTLAGVLVVGTKASVVGLDSKSGNRLWQLDDLKGYDVTPELLLRRPYALLGLKKGVRGKVVRVLIDVTTGREVWDSTTPGLTGVYHEVYVPWLDVLLAAGEADDRKVVVVIDLESGRRLGEIAVPEAEIGSIFGKPMLFDSDSTLVTVSSQGLVRYDMLSSAKAWASPKLETGRHIDCLFPDTPEGKSGFVVAPNAQRKDPRSLLPTAPMLLSDDGQCLFVPWGQTLQAVDARGMALWPNRPELCGRCVQLIETGNGVLARTMPEIAGNDQLAMVERGSGAVLWQYPRTSKGPVSVFKTAFEPVALSNPVMDSSAAYVLAGSHLVRLDLATGRASKLGETRIDEKGVHLKLEREGGGFVVVGQQEIEWLDHRGKSFRHVHHKPPSNILTGIAQLGTIAVVEHVLWQQAKNSGWREIETENGWARVSPSGRMTLEESGRMTMRAFDRTVVAKTSGGTEPFAAIRRSFTRQFHSSSNVDTLVLMLANLHEAGIQGPALVGIDKRSGETVQRIPVSREPRYEIDPLSGWIFIMDSKTIRGHAL